MVEWNKICSFLEKEKKLNAKNKEGSTPATHLQHISDQDTAVGHDGRAKFYGNRIILLLKSSMDPELI